MCGCVKVDDGSVDCGVITSVPAANELSGCLSIIEGQTGDDDNRSMSVMEEEGQC
jgi:hypothetical protein